MAHPDHRRRGIGRALLEAAKAECRRRGGDGFLLVCEGASPSGNAFARAVGAEYRFSEYRMKLDPAGMERRSVSPEETIRVERADAADVDTLVRLHSASSGGPEEASRRRIAQWLSDPNQQFYVGGGKEGAVGMLRVARFGTTVYLNTFSVLPEYRGRGYGRQILTGVIDVLLAEPVEIMIEVETENRAALSLYLSCGFKETHSFAYFRVAA